MKFLLKQQGKLHLMAVATAMACGLFFAGEVQAAEPSSPGAAAQQQAATVTGTVVDNTGEPIIGASVSVYDPTQSKPGVTTDIDGNFVIKARPGERLEIKFIGYKTAILPAKDKMKVVLEEEAEVLEGIEVVAYGVQKKVTVTGAIASVKGDDLVRTPVSSVNNVLAGQLSGVTTVQYSGEPGADAAQIFVRGKATWVDASPLIQVDGVERDMWDIDPNEIESITVLKDASATAVFGVRGANGVVLITTKRGAEGKAKISVSLNFSAQRPTKLIEMANSVEYANFYNQMRIGDGATAPFSDEVIAKFTSDNPIDQIRFPNMRWTDYIFKKTTFQQQHNVNISGGNDKVKYFVSGGFFSQDGIFEQYGRDDYAFDYRYNRFNYRANIDINVTKSTLVSVNVAGKIDNSAKPQTGQGASGMIKAVYGASPFSSSGFDSEGRYLTPTVDPLYNTEYDADGNSKVVVLPFVGSAPMTYITYQTGAYHNTANTVMMDLVLDQKLDFITKNLSLKVKGSYNSGFNQTKTLAASAATYTPKLMPDGHLEYLVTSWEDSPTYSEPSSASGKWRNWYLEGSLNWNRVFGNHTLSALVLYNQSKNYYPSTYSDIARTYVGLVSRVTYDYDNRYLAEVNFGYNGSENFAPGKRFGAFPAGSLGWIISNEQFMKSLNPFLSFLKLRLTLGLVGNDKVGGSRFMYLSDPYVVNSTALFQRVGKEVNYYGYYFGIGESAATQPGATEVSKNNPEVTWEKSLKKNIGVDAYFMNNRLKGSFDYYKEHRTDILWQDNTSPGILGFTLPYTNFGIVDSWGWEISLGWNDHIGKNFNYWANLNLSYNNNKIIEDRQAPQSEDYMYTAGRQIGSRSLYKFWKYYDSNTSEAEYQAEFGQPLPTQFVDTKYLKDGDALYVDLNGDGKIDANDASRDLGKTDDPRYIAGLTLGFAWKGFSFNTQLTAAWDMTRVLDGAFRYPFWNAAGNDQGGLLIYHLNNSWSPTNTNAEYPRATIANKSQNYVTSTLWEKDASYVRCKTMMVAYDFNMPWMKKLGLTQFQLSLSAYNLFTFTDYKWGDPENRASSSPDYPLTRTYTAGLKVAF